MTQAIRSISKLIDKEANAMASNEVEVLDPTATVEKDNNTVSEGAVNRRNLLVALSVAGAVAGASLVSRQTAFAQQPKPTGYKEFDVINFLLNIKYLKATLYSYITTGADLSTTVTSGTGAVFNPLAKITFSGSNAAQITDMFNEMYYDELNQVIALRALQGSTTANRNSIDLLGTMNTANKAATTITQNQAIGIARMLEDLSVQALAGASVYLSGSNRALISQIMAVDGAHAGALRLVCIQNGIPYLGTSTVATAAAGTQTVNSFTGGTTSGSPTVYTLAPAATNPITVGNAVSGVGVPAGAVITAVVSAANKTFTAVAIKGSFVLTSVSSVSGLLPGQPITGTGIPAFAYITNVGTNTVTFAAPGVTTGASATSTIAPTGVITSGSNVISGVSSISGVAVGQAITGSGIPANSTVTAVSSSSAKPLTITISSPATATSTVAPTGVLVSGSNVITSVSSLSGITNPAAGDIGQVITGAGIPAGTTVTATSSGPNTITLSNAATASTSTAIVAHPTGLVTSGGNSISAVSSTTGVAVGQPISGAGIPDGTTVTALNATAHTITISQNAVSTTPVTPVATFTGVIVPGSADITSVSNFTGVAVGLPISGGVAGGTGGYLPAGLIVTAFSASARTVTVSGVALGSIGATQTVIITTAQTINTYGTTTVTVQAAPVALTINTTETITVGMGTVTMSANANTTGAATLTVSTADSMDVEPADLGTAAAAAAGPTAVPSSSPTIYQGFFDTAGTATASANTPAGFAFARTFSQVLSVLYGGVDSNSNAGGFFPVGVAGNINVV
jgi:hypothetical protein